MKQASINRDCMPRKCLYNKNTTAIIIIIIIIIIIMWYSSRYFAMQ